MDVRIVSNPLGPLLGQAREFQSADIIISSHGAQLANLAFIRPCTVVVELFPYAYHLGFFQAFALAGDGISFDAYPFDASPLTDTEVRTLNRRDSKMRRGVPIQASPESIVHAFPKLLLKMMTCRENWKGVVDWCYSTSITDILSPLKFIIDHLWLLYLSIADCLATAD
jgi:hypothetical protein